MGAQIRYLDGETEEMDIGKEQVRVESHIGERFPVLSEPPAPLAPPSASAPLSAAQLESFRDAKGKLRLSAWELVGTAVAILSRHRSSDNADQSATVTAFDPASGKHTVREQETVRLRRRRWCRQPFQPRGVCVRAEPPEPSIPWTARFRPARLSFASGIAPIA